MTRRRSALPPPGAASRAPTASEALGVPDGLRLDEGTDAGQARILGPVGLDGRAVLDGGAQDPLEVAGSRGLESGPVDALRAGDTGQVDRVDVAVGGEPRG